MPTIKLPTIKNPFSKEKTDQRAVALTPAPTLHHKTGPVASSAPAPLVPTQPGPAASPIPSTIAQGPAAPVTHVGEGTQQGQANALSELAFTFYTQGKLAEAEAAMLKAVALRPYDKQLRNNLGVIYGHQGRAREALEQFRLATSEADACTNVGEILAAHNDKAGAREYLQQAVAADPNHARAKQGLAALGDGQAQVADRPPAAATR